MKIIKLPKLNGDKYLADSNLFVSDPIDFGELNNDLPEDVIKTLDCEAEIILVKDNMRFIDLFSEKSYLTEEQIIWIVSKFPNIFLKRKSFYIPFRKKGNLYVAKIMKISDKKFDVTYFRFHMKGRTWFISAGDRVIRYK